MRSREIDPRDTLLENWSPSYRVIFWDGQTFDAWELTETDLDDVLAWIEERSGGRSHSLWVTIPTERDGLRGVDAIRLRGIDKVDDPSLWPRWAREVSL